MAMNNNFSINETINDILKKGFNFTAKTDAETKVEVGPDVDTSAKVDGKLDVTLKADDAVFTMTNNPYTAQFEVYDMVMKRAMERAEKEKKKAAQATEEWVWITGYKGTNKDMKCRDQQYELGKQFTMPEDADIVDCHCGFHLCKKLEDVFNYYNIEEGHRFFEVQALVRKKDVEEYGKRVPSGRGYFFAPDTRDKLAAKSIILTRELTVDEILDNHPKFKTMTAKWTPEQRQEAVTTSVFDVRNKIRAEHLTTLGYSEAFAKYVVKRGYYEEAVAVSTQEDLSMDMKIVAILEM